MSQNFSSAAVLIANSIILLIFYKKKKVLCFSSKMISEIPPECQTVWIKIILDVLSVLVAGSKLFEKVISRQHLQAIELTLKAPPIFFAADDNFKFCCFFKNNKLGMIFHEMLADDTHAISGLIF